MSGRFIVIRGVEHVGGEDYPRLEMRTVAGGQDGPLVHLADVTADELARMLDEDCEGANYRELIGWAAKLADIIATQYPLAVDAEDMARRALWEIARHGGFTEGVTS